jgi:hypothetical protein
VVLPATTTKQKAARCLGWAICIEIASLIVGLFLFFGSIHSSAVMICASAVIVPPLFLVIFGLLRPDNFLTMVITVAALQFPVSLLAAFVVVTVRDSYGSRRNRKE